MNQASQIWIEHFRSALRWRRRVERQLLEVSLTLTQWLALDALETLYAQAGEAVSQARIGAQLELDRATMSDVMDRLARRKLITRFADNAGSEWRVSPTEEGKRRASLGRSMIDVTSKSMLAARAAVAARHPETVASRHAMLDW